MKLTPRQQQAQEVLAGDATHLMLFGGSRSGKTFLLTRNVVMRALKAPKSRHAILRFRFNAVKSSVVLDTFPKVMSIAFPGVAYTLSKTDWYAEFENGSQIWFAGLDDKERTEKILGMEFATIYLNEASQIPKGSRDIALTRLAQKAYQQVQGREPAALKPRMYYDCNPPSKAHWTFKMFVQKVDPETREPLAKPNDYASFQINPMDNRENISEVYLESLEGLSGRLKRRFVRGEFGEATPNALFDDAVIDRWRVMDDELPSFVRVVVAVDPSGASDDGENADNDEVGIVVDALGTDGRAYLLEDLTVKAGPATWGRVAVEAYMRHKADAIVGETNFGGGMVESTIKVAAAKLETRVPFKKVTASRGKTQRAEPFSALYEEGKVRHVGLYPALEDELCAFSTGGYTGAKSPNRGDAHIWGLAALFPAMTKPEVIKAPFTPTPMVTHYRKP